MPISRGLHFKKRKKTFPSASGLNRIGAVGICRTSRHGLDIRSVLTNHCCRYLTRWPCVADLLSEEASGR